MSDNSDEIILTKPHLIVPEGASDKSLLEHLFSDRGVEGFQIEVPIGGWGVNKIAGVFKLLPLQPRDEQLSSSSLTIVNDHSPHHPFPPRWHKNPQVQIQHSAPHPSPH